MNQLLAHLLNSFLNKQGWNGHNDTNREVLVGRTKWVALAAIVLVPVVAVVVTLLVTG